MFRYFLLGGDSAAPSGPATPMTNGVISETLRQFGPLSDISQGSVATHFMYGGIFSDGFIANYFS